MELPFITSLVPQDFQEGFKRSSSALTWRLPAFTVASTTSTYQTAEALEPLGLSGMKCQCVIECTYSETTLPAASGALWILMLAGQAWPLGVERSGLSSSCALNTINALVGYCVVKPCKADNDAAIPEACLEMHARNLFSCAHPALS